VHRSAAMALAIVATSLTGCAGEEFDAAQAAESEVEPLRLGRVHVLLEPESDLPYDEAADEYPDTLEVTARFAFVRGLEEDFVRALIDDVPVLATDVVAPQSCIASDQLGVDALDAPTAEFRELHLVDAGELRLQIGDGPEGTVEVPATLPPDLLPYMTGFRYLYSGDQPSTLMDDGETTVVVEARGSQTDELPPFHAEGFMPGPLALHMTEVDLDELSRGALVLRWEGADVEADELLTLRFTGLQGSEPVGADVTCVVSDVGQVRLALDNLRTLGLLTDAEGLRVTASRLHTSLFDAGDFSGSELLVERREALTLTLR